MSALEDASRPRRRLFSARTRFTSYVLILVGCLSALLSFSLLSISERHVYGAYQARIQFILQEMKTAAVETLQGTGVDPLEALLSVGVRQDDVALLAVFDSRGELVARAGGQAVISLEEDLKQYGRTADVARLRASLGEQGLQLLERPLLLERPTDHPQDSTARPPRLLGTLIAGHQPERAIQAVDQLKKRSQYETALLGVVALLLMLWATRAFTAPVLELARATAKIAQGQAPVLSPHRKDEIGDLAGLFQRMSRRVSRAHARLQRRQDGLEQNIEDRTHRLLAALRQLQSLEQKKDDLLSTFSHEFRTPLTSMISCGEILQQTDVDEESTGEFAGMLELEFLRLKALTQNFVDHTQLESHSLSLNLNLQSVRPQVILDEVVESLRAKQEAKNCEVTVAMDTAMPEILCDPPLIQKMLRELIDNAIKFSPSGSKVEVCARRLQQDLEITVRDHGQGISELMREDVFQHLQQGASAVTDKPAGTGLGLAISRRIAHLHGGDVRVDEVDGPGNRMVIRLPIEVLPEPATDSVNVTERTCPV